MEEATNTTNIESERKRDRMKPRTLSETEETDRSFGDSQTVSGDSRGNTDTTTENDKEMPSTTGESELYCPFNDSPFIGAEDSTVNTKSKEKNTSKNNDKKKDNKKEKNKKNNDNKNKNKDKDNKNKKSDNKKIKLIIIIVPIVVTVCVIAIILGVVFGLKSAKKGNSNPNNEEMYKDLVSDIEDDRIYDSDYPTNTQVGYYSEVTETMPRKSIPKETKNEGLSEYPKFGTSMNDVLGTTDEKKAARSALIKEASYLTAVGTVGGGGGEFTWMDKDGKLYSGTVSEPVPTVDTNKQQRKLYKHSASVGMYMGNVDDNEPAIVKKVTMRPRQYTRGYSVTGVYAPAGEVIKIEISEEDMNNTGGVTIHIGQALYNGKANNIWVDKNAMPRFPVILNTMTISKDTATYDEKRKVYTGYVGSFVGGPLYIRFSNVTFTVTISGGVAYSHFILGYTTKEEFEKNAKSSAPYFDLEVWDTGVLHSGPREMVKNLSYEDFYKAAVLWDKVASVTTTGSIQGIVFLYEPFVAAGAAVAFVGQGSVNCPTSWMIGSLDYNQVISVGSWGNFHEYHHHFQGYGVGDGGEVTNNGMNLVSYVLFTKISSARNMGDYGGNGLASWNRYTSATWALADLLKIQQGGTPSNGKNGLAIYATLLHNFGPDNYIQAKIEQQQKKYGESHVGYMRAWQTIVHYDMTYFFKDVLAGIDQDAVNEYKPTENYPVFVPISSVYQTGRSYNYDGKKTYFNTMQPFNINYGEEFIIDLNKYTMTSDSKYASGSLIYPAGFTHKIKKVSQPEHGKITQVKENLYKYTPDKNLRSGKIIVTVGLTKVDESFVVEDVDLVLEFAQSFDSTKSVLERTTYMFDTDKIPSDAATAFTSNYAGYSSVTKIDHSNPTQNSNTDIWLIPDPDNTGTSSSYPNAKPEHFLPSTPTPDRAMEISGKLLFSEAGKYRIFLRGRFDCAAFFSLDGKDYSKYSAYIKDPSRNNNFRPTEESTYVDIDVENDETFVHFKEVLMVKDSSFIGLGVGQWAAPMFTTKLVHYNKDGEEITEAEASELEGSYSETLYYDAQGNEVSEDVANSAQLEPPTAAQYATGYRSNYEIIHEEFTTEYYYTRSYSYTYADNVLQSGDQSVIEITESKEKDGVYRGYTPAEHKPENICDGNRTTYVHSHYGVDDSNVFTVLLDLGEAKAVNRMTIHTQPRPKIMVPNKFKFRGSLDGVEFFDVADFADLKAVNSSVTVDFKETTLRYYELIITGSTNSYAIIGEIELWKIFEVRGQDNVIVPDSERIVYDGVWAGVKTLSSFGHVYLGAPGATATVEFAGTRVGFISSYALGTDFEVLIDGKRMESIGLKKNNSGSDKYGITYLSEKLNSGRHTAVFKCVGKANVDSVVTFDEK